MNSKLNIEEKSKKNYSPRKTRHSRNSPNPKLLNAAWPKAPSVPTKQSHIKAVDHSEFQQSWSEWRQQAGNQPPGECSIEDMEVDDDVITRTSQIRRRQPAVGGELESSNPTDRQLLASATRTTLRGNRRAEKSDGKKSGESSSANTKIEVCEATSTSDAESSKKSVTSATKQKDLALFIIIHVSKVEVGLIKGPASSPVKIFADKFMVQMEDEETKKDISFRIPCRSISALEISLLEKPFMIKMVTSNINYVSNGPTKNRRSKGPPVKETVVLHLGYEETVPKNIRNDLQELFKVRLADLNLWPALPEEAPEKSLHTQPDAAREKPTAGSNGPSSDTLSKTVTMPTQTRNYSSRKNVIIESSNVNNERLDVTRESHVEFSRKTRQSSKKQPAAHNSKAIVRKRTPEQPLVTNQVEKETQESGTIKVAKRSHTDLTNSLEERVKTLSHEAAHYQMLSAQQRMIMQSLEEEIRRNTRNYETQLEIMRGELTSKQTMLDSKSSEVAHEERESSNLESMHDELVSLRKELNTRDSLLRARNASLDNSEETIRQLRNSAKKTSACSGCTNRKTNKGNESTVPISVMEETRQNLMQLQVSKEHLSMELERARAELVTSNRNFQSLRQQMEVKEEDIERKRREIEALSASLHAAQTDLANSSRSVESLTRQISEVTESQQASCALTEELNNLRARLGDAHIEIDELKTQLREFQGELKKPFQENLGLDWIIERGEVKLSDEVVGVGAWGNVKVGTFRGTRIAVKQIHLLILSPHNRRLFEREMTIASRCRHPCLVQFIGATNDDGTPLFIMELLESNLRTLLLRETLDNFDCIQIAFDVIRAITYLHLSKPLPIIHRDISSSNVLLYRGQYGWRGKLSDYGAANFVRISMTRHPGALLYSAPEASTIDQTPKLDVYSFGVLFCEMCTRELPLPEKRSEQVGNITEPEHRSLVNNCLRLNIEKRWDSLSVAKKLEEWNRVALNEKVTASNPS